MLAPVSFFKLLKLLKLQDIYTLAVGRCIHKIIYKNKASFILDGINKLQVIPSQFLKNKNKFRLSYVFILRFKCISRPKFGMNYPTA